MSGLCRKDPELAYKKNGIYYIRLTVLSTRPGFDLISALMITTQTWVKAVDAAQLSGLPRRTLASWCLTRPRFANRIGRVWYVNVEALGADEDELEFLASISGNDDDEGSTGSS